MVCSEMYYEEEEDEEYIKYTPKVSDKTILLLLHCMNFIFLLYK
jgi:hypothetical protein